MDGASQLRFWALVDRTTPTECWRWLGRVFPNGYGRAPSWARMDTYAHRVAWMLANGPVPWRLELDHLCRNRWCVNPGHLEAVTHRENVLRSPIAQAAINARKTHCVHGHPFDEANTIVTAPGRRACRACRLGKWKTHRPDRATAAANGRLAVQEMMAHKVRHPNIAGPTAVNAAKTHCPAGHEYDYLYKNGKRACRACLNANKRACYARAMSPKMPLVG